MSIFDFVRIEQTDVKVSPFTVKSRLMRDGVDTGVRWNCRIIGKRDVTTWFTVVDDPFEQIFETRDAALEAADLMLDDAFS